MQDSGLVVERTALIVVDMQNDFCHPEGALARKGGRVDGLAEVAANLEAFLDRARASGVKPVFIQTIHEECTDSEVWLSRLGGSNDICRRGSWGADFFRVKPLDGEPVVNKHRYSAFFQTRLDAILRSFQIDTVLLSGVATNVCVEGTARDAFQLGYRVILLADCCGAYSAEEHEAALRNVGRFFGRVQNSTELALERR